MKLSQKGIELLQVLENTKLTAYLDTNGIWTIGTGHTSGVTQGQTITAEQSLSFLKEDVRMAENCVVMNVKKPINQNQFDALVIFTFNVGCNAFKNSTLLKKINECTYSQDVAFQMRRWVHDAKGNVVEGLKNRREAEIKLYFDTK